MAATYDDSYTMRANSKEVQKFKRHCSKKLRIPHQEVIREVMSAIVEGRVTITKPKEQNEALGALYK